MHRHSYNGRKLQRAAGPRKALIRGQITSLILHEAITTTEAKAKELRPHFERVVTKAKLANLTGERAVRKVVLTETAAQKMVRELAPNWSDRQGGYTRIIKLANRRGDNAPMARISLVLDAPVAPVTSSDEPKASTKPNTAKPKPEKTEETPS